MAVITDPDFMDNPVIKGREDRYTTITINVPAVLESWRLSLFSYEWVRPDGQIKDVTELPAAEQPKRKDVEASLNAGKTLERPVLGIGLMDNVEIGSGRATFLTLAAHGCRSLDVHVPKSNLKEFGPFKV